MVPDTRTLVAAILNASYPVRNCPRPLQREQRAKAIRKLGLTVRDAFDRSDDFEALLAAVADGLRPRDDLPF